MFCARCGQEIAETADLCPHCGQGARLQVVPQPAPVITQPYTALQQSALSYGSRPDLHGVGGWLLFFCVSMTILSPLFGFRFLADELALNLPEGLLDLARLVFAMITGILVWLVNSRALIMLRIYFGVTAAIAVLGIVEANIGPNHSAANVTSLLYGRTLLVTVVWFLYFRTSARVRETFGRNI